jgi:site-specific DNA-methyltransferase (adenine-specific)
MRKPDWQTADESIRLYLGDCLDVLPGLEESSIDAVLTDPPYSSGGAFRGDRAQRTVAKYVNSDSGQREFRQEFSGDSRDQRSFFAWCSLWLSAARHTVVPGGVLCSFIDWRQLPVMTDSVQAGGWVWRNIATWWKPGCRMQRGRFSASAEYLVYATNGPQDQEDGEQSPQNVIACQPVAGEEKSHIAEKPLEVVVGDRCHKAALGSARSIHGQRYYRDCVRSIWSRFRRGRD